MKRISLLLLVVFPLVLHGQWQSLHNLVTLTHSAPNQISMSDGRAALTITILAPDLARVRLATTGIFQPDSSWAVTRSSWPSFLMKIDDRPNDLLIETDELAIIVQKYPIRVRFIDPDGRVLNQDEAARGMSWNGTEVRVWKNMPEDEYYFGFGEKAGRFQKKFTHMTMWNSDIPGYGIDTDPLYQSIPFFYGIRNGRAYGIFFDNTYWSSFDMGKSSRTTYSFGAEDGELNYYFFAGPTPRDVLARFTDLVGRMPLPPLWSLGYQQSRWSYPTEERVREVAREFRNRKIPCDVLYLDIDYMDGYRIFTWNRTGFPDPVRMIGDLKAEGFRTAVIVDPGIKKDTSYHAYRTGLAGKHFLVQPDSQIYVGKVWPGICAFPDFSSPSTRAWWGDNFRSLITAGVRGWWNDMNEPSVFDVPTKTIDLHVIHYDFGMHSSHKKNHNVYGLQMTKATYEGVKKILPSERPFVLTRATYAGGHRYSSAWTGDNLASWDHLKLAVPMCLNLSVSGQPFVGSDIGGFIGYPTGELFTRWLQFGVFTPLMRAHSVINERNKEPWEYGEEYTHINRESINLRYRLLPYLYNAMVHAANTGIPPMRPLVFDYPSDPAFLWSDTEFLFGEDFLVAPVLDAGATTRTFRLPDGIWYDFWSTATYTGGRTITLPAPIERIPLLVKAGTILPHRDVVQHTGEKSLSPLLFDIYPGVLQSSSTYYEDDGLSYDYEQGGYWKRSITQWNSSRATTLIFGKAEGSYVPPDRMVGLTFHDVREEPREVTVDGKPIPRSSGENRIQYWTYHHTTGRVLVWISDSRNEARIRLSYK